MAWQKSRRTRHRTRLAAWPNETFKADWAPDMVLAEDEQSLRQGTHEELNPPPPATAPTGEQAVLFEHENRLRALEGMPPLSVADFIGKMKR